MRIWRGVLVAVLWIASSLVNGQSGFDSAKDPENRSLDDVLASGFIEIAVYRDFPPYSYQDDGAPRGVDIELGKLIASGLGVEPRWFWLTPDENLEADLRNAVWRGSLFDRKVADVMLRVPYDRNYSYAIDGYGIPKHEHVVFLGPYQREGWAIARDLEKTGDTRNLAIFAYEKVGVEIASLPDMILSGAYNGRLRDNVVHYPSPPEALQGLRAGDVAAVVAMRSQLDWGLRDVPGRFDVDDDGLQLLSVQAWDIGVAVRENHRQMGYAIGDIIDAAVRDGTVAGIFAEYGLGYRLPSTHAEAE